MATVSAYAGTVSWIDTADLDWGFLALAEGASDDAGAISDTSLANYENTDLLRASDFVFGHTFTGIETILSITLTIRRRRLPVDASGEAYDVTVTISVGAQNKADLATNWPEAFADKVYGGDLWGASINPVDLNTLTADFRAKVGVGAAGCQAEVDSFHVSIDYSPFGDAQAPIHTTIAAAAALCVRKAWAPVPYYCRSLRSALLRWKASFSSRFLSCSRLLQSPHP